MAHIIQPLEIEGNLYCVNQHGYRATQGVNTDILGAPTGTVDVSNPASPWTVTGTQMFREITFGVGCGTDVELQFTTTKAGVEELFITIFVNDVEYDYIGSLDALNTPYNTTVSLDDLPCGSIISMVIDGAVDVEYVTSIEIISIT